MVIWLGRAVLLLPHIVRQYGFIHIPFLLCLCFCFRLAAPAAEMQIRFRAPATPGSRSRDPTVARPRPYGHDAITLRLRASNPTVARAQPHGRGRATPGSPAHGPRASLRRLDDGLGDGLPVRLADEHAVLGGNAVAVLGLVLLEVDGERLLDGGLVVLDRKSVV